MKNSVSWDRMLDALADRYRRQLLVALLEHNPQRDDDVDPLAVPEPAGIDVQKLEIDIVHRHLPKLSELGFVSWDRESGDISKGPNWAEIEPLVRLLRDHREELPDDWL